MIQRCLLPSMRNWAGFNVTLAGLRTSPAIAFSELLSLQFSVCLNQKRAGCLITLFQQAGQFFGSIRSRARHSEALSHIDPVDLWIANIKQTGGNISNLGDA